MRSSSRFTKKNRLCDKWRFSQTFGGPVRRHAPFATLYAVPNKENSTRLGIVIAKRNAKKAVSRNLFKRVSREAFRNYKPTGWDVVLVGKKSFERYGKQKYRRWLTQELEHLKRNT